MKKLFAMLLAVLLMLTAVPVLAATWDNPDVTSPYSVTVIPVKLTVNLFGQTSWEKATARLDTEKQKVVKNYDKV